jgi:hypothetical protein
VCDSGDVDEDCNGLADDNDPGVSAGTKSTFYLDADGDGYGVATTSVSNCNQPSGYSTFSTDCDDTNALRDPGNTEVCDADDLDEDCDGLADDDDPPPAPARRPPGTSTPTAMVTATPPAPAPARVNRLPLRTWPARPTATTRTPGSTPAPPTCVSTAWTPTAMG